MRQAIVFSQRMNVFVQSHLNDIVLEAHGLDANRELSEIQTRFTNSL